jgi:hypothetical protein
MKPGRKTGPRLYGGLPERRYRRRTRSIKPEGEVLHSQVGEDALAFTTLPSRYSTLTKIIILLTVDLHRPYSVKKKSNKMHLLTIHLVVPLFSVALHSPLLSLNASSKHSPTNKARFPILKQAVARGAAATAPHSGWRADAPPCPVRPTVHRPRRFVGRFSW